MKRVIRATTNPAVTEREKRNALLARKIGAEGIVLLENNGALPLKRNKVALYGLGARHTAFGGTGSGENRPRYRVTVEEGLKNEGYFVATKAWLNALDTAYETARKAWRKQFIKGMKKHKKTEQMDYASAHSFLPPLGPEIVKEDTDTALYVLTRQAGEGSDRTTQAGDYYIRPEELEQLKTLCALYPETVLILNVSGVVDLSFTKELSLSAILLVLQGGMEAGNAIADVLSGKVTPSGRLASTWAERYEDYPSYDTYSYMDGNPREEDYFENVFVGYRYFHAKNVKARYPFGYGLSYTRFQQTVKQITVTKDEVTCRVSVENIGGCAGKEVVQIYLSAPNGKLLKEKVSLAGFAKTKLLQPAESEETQVIFSLSDFASYDEESASFLLEQGDYVVYLGRNAEDLTAIGMLALNQTVTTERCKNVCPLNKEINFFAPDMKREVPDLERIAINADEIECTVHSYPKPAPPESEEVKLSVNEKIKLLVGTSYIGGARNTVFGAAGYTTSAFFKRGIPNMPMTDGPQGLNVKPVSKKPKQNLINFPAIPEDMRYGLMGLLAGRDRKEGAYYQYATAFPSEMLCAQTWDTQLIKEEGRAVGEEMVELGIVYFLAPAMNIQRNPLCGRNYEYYSEDPLLTGKIAAAITLGVQEHTGRYATLKHYACNNLETERNRSSSNLNERTLREIYLKAFKIAVREGNAKSVMASYNKINGKYVCNSYELLTDVLRNEFGFDGVVMTDWLAAGHDDSYVEACAPAGCDLVMPGFPGEVKKIKRAHKKGAITKEQIEVAAHRIIKAARNQY